MSGTHNNPWHFCTNAQLVDGTKLFDFINIHVNRAIMIHTGIEKEVIIPSNQSLDKCNILVDEYTALKTRHLWVSWFYVCTWHG